ncbi:MAG: hypothetical protein L0Z70_05745 [Chloroflexi bacterium]|nr:hypothetical protein [Chloroflexota bacterium]
MKAPSHSYRFDLFSAVALIALGVTLTLSAAAVSQARAAAPQPTPTAGPMMPVPEGGLIYSNLPENATQLEYGAEAYRLVCNACHGDKGQGLTADWLAHWAPDDRNCWQSKCHASNHPDDGFYMPTNVPPVIGPGRLSAYRTAKDLNDYIARTMPYQDPGNMEAQEYLNITAFLLAQNGIDPIIEELTEERAAQILINPPPTQTAPAPTPAPVAAAVVTPPAQPKTPFLAQPAFWAWTLGFSLLLTGAVFAASKLEG